MSERGRRRKRWRAPVLGPPNPPPYVASPALARSGEKEERVKIKRLRRSPPPPPDSVQCDVTRADPETDPTERREEMQMNFVFVRPSIRRSTPVRVRARPHDSSPACPALPYPGCQSGPMHVHTRYLRPSLLSHLLLSPPVFSSLLFSPSSFLPNFKARALLAFDIWSDE